MEIDILVEDPAWEAAGIEEIALGACPAALAGVGLPPGRFAVSLLACDDDRISGLNAEFRGRPAPTNVLSWPSAERAAASPGAIPDLPSADNAGPAIELGDIAIAYGVCRREAEAAGRPLEHHVAHLLVHGTLHLLGFDHETDADAELMEKLETRILARLGVPDPY
jgi:probable rRNA maturation factor